MASSDNLAHSSSGPSNLALILGILAFVALIYCDLRVPAITEWSNFARIYYPDLKIAAEHGSLNFAQYLNAAPPQASEFSKILALPHDVSFIDAPLCLKLMQPLTSLEFPAAIIVWHVLSFIAVIVSALLITRAAASLQMDEEHGGRLGWVCFTFAPVLMTLALGELGLVFGLLPLALGYFLLVRKQPALAGLAWALLVLKPAFLIVPLVNCIAQGFNKRFVCLIALVFGTVFLGLGTAVIGGDSPEAQMWRTAFSSLSVQPMFDPALNVSFQHAAMSFAPNLTGVAPVLALVGVMIAVGGLMQLYALAKSEDTEREVIPFATMLGTMMVPILVPQLPYYDLSVLVLGGLVAYCYEWREHMEFRTRTVVRLSWLVANGYLILYCLNRPYAHPAELIALLLVFYLRLAETVNFAAHTPNFS